MLASLESRRGPWGLKAPLPSPPPWRPDMGYIVTRPWHVGVRGQGSEVSSARESHRHGDPERLDVCQARARRPVLVKGRHDVRFQSPGGDTRVSSHHQEPLSVPEVGALSPGPLPHRLWLGSPSGSPLSGRQGSVRKGPWDSTGCVPALGFCSPAARIRAFWTRQRPQPPL